MPVQSPSYPSARPQWDPTTFNALVAALRRRDQASPQFPASEGWTTSNVTTDRTLNANSTTLDEVADVLCTLIEDLKAIGVLS